jgi:hypothetical protein
MRRTIAVERGATRGRAGNGWLNGLTDPYGRQHEPGQWPAKKGP